jgi:nicotinamide-nucleotide amidase
VKAVIITIGNEILSGDTVDTNSAYLAGELGELGVRVVARYSVPDEAPAIARAVRRGLAEAGLVVTTGGLGPTRDDLTLAAVAAEIGRELVVDPEQARRVREVFARRAIEMPAINQSQYRRLDGATIVYNPSGTAPGQLAAADGGHVCLLPGVPKEVRELWEAGIRGAVADLTDRPLARLKRTVRTVGVSESVLAQRLEDAGVTAALDDADVELAFLPRHGLVDLRITRFYTEDDRGMGARFEELADAIVRTVGGCVYGFDTVTLAGAVGRRLGELGLTLGTAESCTGGGIGKWITDVPGSSAYFLGGVVAYSNEVKIKLLGVPTETLETHGAVSRETAAAMAEGALEALGCDVAVSTTGVAGPGGGSAEKPVGTVFVGLAQHQRTLDGWPSARGSLLDELQRTQSHETRHFLFTRRLKLTGDRDLVRRRTVIHALDTLRRRLADWNAAPEGRTGNGGR